jgi:hypothetical protein
MRSPEPASHGSACIHRSELSKCHRSDGLKQTLNTRKHNTTYQKRKHNTTHTHALLILALPKSQRTPPRSPLSSITPPPGAVPHSPFFSIQRRRTSQPPAATTPLDPAPPPTVRCCSPPPGDRGAPCIGDGHGRREGRGPAEARGVEHELLVPSPSFCCRRPWGDPSGDHLPELLLPATSTT